MCHEVRKGEFKKYDGGGSDTDSSVARDQIEWTALCSGVRSDNEIEWCDWVQLCNVVRKRRREE